MTRHSLAPTLAIPLLLAACGGPAPPAQPDLSAAADLGAADLTAADLTAVDQRPAPDLAPPTVTGVPQDCAAGTTAMQLYTSVVSTKCAVTNCHGTTGSVHFSISSAADLRTQWVNVKADQTVVTPMNRVTPGDVNKSYLVYKLFGQQDKASDNAGTQMPQGGSMLGHDDLCRFISWIQGGAN